MTDRKMLDSIVGSQASSDLMNAMQGGASRRDVLGMLLAGGMRASLAGSLALTAVSAHAQTPRRGGHLRVAGQTDSVNSTLDPAKSSNQADYCRCFMLYNGLSTLDGTLTPRPELAEAFNTDDARTWVFPLRKGVRFHDGSALTPQDVVFSLMRLKDPATASPAKVLADQISEVKASGPSEVTVVLGAPNADLPAILGTFQFLIVKAGTKNFNAGIGTGPFKLKEFQPGVRSLVVRNDQYWKPGQPYLDSIEYVGIGDDNARVNALLSGQMDLIGAIKPYAVPRVRSTPGYEVFVTHCGKYTDLIMREDVAPGSHPDFVLAMKYLQNRSLMQKSITQGYSVLGNDQPIDPTNRFYFAGLPQRPYDPDKARFHLKKSGVTGTIPVVASPAADYSVEMAVVMQQAARGIGLKLDVRRMPADGYWSTYWLTSAVGFGNINARPTADMLLTQFFKSDARWNESRWKSPKFDQLLVAARAETDLAKRKRMYADMQTMIHDQAGIGIPLFLDSLDAHSSKLKGMSPIPIAGLMGYNFADHVWFEA